MHFFCAELVLQVKGSAPPRAPPARSGREGPDRHSASITHLIDTRALRAEFLRLHALLRFAQLEIFYSYKYLKVNYRVLRLHKNIVSLRVLAADRHTDGQTDK